MSPLSSANTSPQRSVFSSSPEGVESMSTPASSMGSHSVKSMALNNMHLIFFFLVSHIFLMPEYAAMLLACTSIAFWGIATAFGFFEVDKEVNAVETTVSPINDDVRTWVMGTQPSPDWLAHFTVGNGKSSIVTKDSWVLVSSANKKVPTAVQLVPVKGLHISQGIERLAGNYIAYLWKFALPLTGPQPLPSGVEYVNRWIEFPFQQRKTLYERTTASFFGPIWVEPHPNSPAAQSDYNNESSFWQFIDPIDAHLNPKNTEVIVVTETTFNPYLYITDKPGAWVFLQPRAGCPDEQDKFVIEWQQEQQAWYCADYHVWFAPRDILDGNADYRPIFGYAETADSVPPQPVIWERNDSQAAAALNGPCWELTWQAIEEESKRNFAYEEMQAEKRAKKFRKLGRPVVKAFLVQVHAELALKSVSPGPRQHALKVARENEIAQAREQKRIARMRKERAKDKVRARAEMYGAAFAKMRHFKEIEKLFEFAEAENFFKELFAEEKQRNDAAYLQEIRAMARTQAAAVIEHHYRRHVEGIRCKDCADEFFQGLYQDEARRSFFKSLLNLNEAARKEEADRSFFQSLLSQKDADRKDKANRAFFQSLLSQKEVNRKDEADRSFFQSLLSRKTAQDKVDPAPHQDYASQDSFIMQVEDEAKIYGAAWAMDLYFAEVQQKFGIDYANDLRFRLMRLYPEPQENPDDEEGWDEEYDSDEEYSSDEGEDPDQE